LDYHAAFVQVCILDGTGRVLANEKCKNDWRVLDRLAARHGAVIEAALESCSGAADLAEELITKAGWLVHLSHPGFVARMKQNPDKTDYQDARLLADLVRVGYLPRVWLAPKVVRELRQLVRYRQQLARERRNAKLRLSALLRENRCWAPEGLRPWTRAWMDWVEQRAELGEQSRWVAQRHLAELARLVAEIRLTEARLAEVTKDDALVQFLLTLSGIGPVTAWTLRAEIGRFDRFRTGRQLSRFCGLSPRNASSGQRQADAGLITAANRDLRTVVIEAAHRLMRHDPRWRAFGQRLRARGKPGSVCAGAVGNRWLRWLFHQVPKAA
jgi:transposase